MNSAANALNKITKEDLTLLKSYVNPPKQVEIVMEGICWVLGENKNVKYKPKAPGSFEKVLDY